MAEEKEGGALLHKHVGRSVIMDAVSQACCTLCHVVRCVMLYVVSQVC